MSTGSGARTPDYFDSAYRDYRAQNPPAKLDHYLDVLDSHLQVSRPRLLDVGCGQGLFLQHTHRRFPDWDLSGIDVEQSAISTSSEVAPSASVQIGQADALPFPASSFDVITAWDVLEHVPDVEGALTEITRCLTPNGLLAIVVPVYDGVTGPIIRLLDRDPTHIHKMARHYWIDLIGHHFSDLEWHGIYRFLLSRSTYLHIPTHALRRATPAILITAHAP